MYCCCYDALLLWCTVVVMYCWRDVLLCCVDILLWWCFVVVMYCCCCCDALLWWYVVGNCWDVLLPWCGDAVMWCEVVMTTFSKVRNTDFGLLNFRWSYRHFSEATLKVNWAVSCDLCSCLSDWSWAIALWSSWMARSCQLRNGLKENEVQRRYAKAYESNYMTEQLAKLVMTVSTQVQKLRSRTPSMRKHHETSYAVWLCK